LVARLQLADFLQCLDIPDAPTMSSKKITTEQVNLVRKQLAEFLITKVVGSVSPSVQDAIELYFREKTVLCKLHPAHKPGMKYPEFAKETGSVPLESVDNYADIIKPDQNLLQTLEKYKAVSFHHNGNILGASKESIHTALKHYFDSQGVDFTAYFLGERLERLWSHEQSAKKPSEVGRHLSCSELLLHPIAVDSFPFPRRQFLLPTQQPATMRRVVEPKKTKSKHILGRVFLSTDSSNAILSPARIYASQR
jgi:hypothetical protein